MARHEYQDIIDTVKKWETDWKKLIIKQNNKEIFSIMVANLKTRLKKLRRVI